MVIHPFWYICISVRIALIFLIRYLYKNKQKKVAALILGLMGLVFLYQSFYGSNNEIQLNKVFWHDTRITHGLLYLISVYYLFDNNLELNSVVLSIDILFFLDLQVLF